jgi:multiple sugar transport system permease protein
VTRQTRRQLSAVARHAVLSLWLIVTVFPIYWMVATAFKLPEQWLAWPPVWFPSPPTLENFAQVWFGTSTASTGDHVLPTIKLEPLHGLRNSVVIAGTATLLSVAFGLLLAYGVSRYQILSERRMFNLLMLRMMPPIVIAIPLVLWYSTLHLLDTWAGMIAVYTIFTLPYSVWMTKSFIDEVPEELEHAAQLLGASKLRAFALIVVPLIRSGVVATCLFILILTWSEYLLGLVMTAADAQTLPVQLSKFEGTQEGRQFGLQSALSIGVTIPLIVIGLLIHKHLVRGFSFGMIRRR